MAHRIGCKEVRLARTVVDVGPLLEFRRPQFLRCSNIPAHPRPWVGIVAEGRIDNVEAAPANPPESHAIYTSIKS